MKTPARRRIMAFAALLVLPMVLGAGTGGTAVAAPAAPLSCTSAPGGQAAPVPAAAPFKVWLAGDSTMANPQSSCPVGWGSQFDALFNDSVTVVNNAVSGRSIQTWLYESNVTSTKDSSGECVVSPNTYAQRWQNMLNATNGMHAGDWLLIQFGINDGTSTCPRHVGSARYQTLLTAMANAAKARGVKTVFITPVAAITCSGSTAVGNRGFLTETRNAAAANGVPLIDLHQLSVNLYNSLRLCPNNGDYTQGAVGAFFCNDHTHFEAAGAVRIAQTVAKALRDQNIPLASFLK